MQEFKPFKEGKVREVYDNGDSLIIVATDRISAFDNILKNKITDKGAILTQMSKFWFDFTKDVVPNHMLSVDVKDMPEFIYRQLIIESHLEKRVKLCPFTKDIQRHYAGASVYVLSSRWEGQPLVLVEAMAHGLPIVSSDLPVAKELLEGRGCGIFFNCGDINDMALALSRMASTTKWVEMSEMLATERLRGQMEAETACLEQGVVLVEHAAA